MEPSDRLSFSRFQPPGDTGRMPDIRHSRFVHLALMLFFCLGFCSFYVLTQHGFLLHNRTQQFLIRSKQLLIDLENVIIVLGDEVF